MTFFFNYYQFKTIKKYVPIYTKRNDIMSCRNAEVTG